MNSDYEYVIVLNGYRSQLVERYYTEYLELEFKYPDCGG